MIKLREISIRAAIAVVLAVVMGTASARTDPLLTGFEDPPMSARPRVWWHWMNGNVTKEGIAKDLEWMQRVGIGGLQNFDANLITPQIVEKRLVYMTPEWKEAFRFAARKADELGLELAIAASPGWSETGGPWVKPEDGMKKLVWSETVIEGGKRFSGKLTAPPSITGPFQDVAVEGELAALLSGVKKTEPPVYYADIAVLAFPVADADPLAVPRAITIGDKPLEADALTDDDFATGVEVARGSPDQPPVVTLEYDKPQTVRSASLFVPNAATLPPRLEASVDGTNWFQVTDMVLTTVPTTVSFAPVTASSFRVVLPPNASGIADLLTPAPGVDLSLFSTLLAPKPTFRIADLRLFPEAKVNQFEAKAGFTLVPDYYALDAQAGPEVAGIDPSQVIDLTSRLKPDGTLEWTAPKGTWRVLRLGWSLTGKTNHPATAEATGLEVDKYDGEAVRAYLEHYIDMYRDAAGSDLVGRNGVRAILTDSIEVGASNWTPGLIERFKRLCGYDPTPYLPALTGVIVGSRTRSNAFLYDFRRTLADLVANEHYGTVAKVAHENGLKVYGEALEGGRPSLGDDIDMRRFADYPMAALWTFPREGGPRTVYRADMKGAASVANLYGQNVVAAESMTSAVQPWAHAPSDLRRMIDLEFAHGINRPVIHTSVHQPVDDKQPGLSLMIFGQFFNRHETWAEMARPWIYYIARNSYMLQQGRNVADVAYFYGEEAPLVAQAIDRYLPDVPTAYAYDFVNPHALLDVLKVDGGKLAAPSGASYRVLYLGGTSHKMTLPVLRRIAELAESGATIVGQAPTGSPSLSDDFAECAALVNKLWSGQPVTETGRGRVIAGGDVEAALARIGVAPDFTYAKPQADSEVLFVHRRLDNGDVYFVNNRRNRAEKIEARFRVTGRAPEIWRADTGSAEPVSFRVEGEHTVVPLEMAAEDSFFVVFRKPATAQSATVTKPAYAPVGELMGPWDVAFQKGRGAPAAIKLTSLESLSEHADAGVKYFSGISTYTKSFTLPKGVKSGGTVLLDLGQVGDLAEVKVNGRSVGTVWHAPYRIDIGQAVKRGANTLEVKVANLWVNRLIGDAQPGAEKVTFTTIPTYQASAPLRPSGLIGPVRLLAASGAAGSD
jgi:hypothetical protein